MSDLMTFIGGAAVGTLVTYLAKNEEARKTTERFIDGVGLAFTNFLHRITPVHAEKTADAVAEPGNPAEKPAEPVRKTTRGRKTLKSKEESNPVH